MNRWLTLLLIGLAGLLASCGTSVRSSTQPGNHDEFTVVVSPDQFTLNEGDWSSISATVELSNQNSTPRAVSPQPTLKFFSSDPRVTISPSGEVCAGQWDTRYLTCTPTVIAQGLPNTGKLDLPTGYVTITAFDASHSASGTSIVSIHPRAIGITLSSPEWLAARDSKGNPVRCISQNQQVKYIATPVFGANAPSSVTPFDNDYAWSVGDANVASVSTHGSVIARNPGVTNVYAKLNGTVSVPLAFATCPPAAIVLESSAFSKGVAVPPFSTADLTLAKGTQTFLTVTTVFDANGATLPTDANGNLLSTFPITYVSSDLLIGAFTNPLPLTADFTANASGRTNLMAACEPSNCNASVPDFVSPAGKETAKLVGFGNPVYSNVIGATVTGTTGSMVLVTGTAFAAPPAGSNSTPHVLLAYDSESLALTHTVGLANTPNSLVVAPNGLKAYLGSDLGLVVVDLSTYQSSTLNFQVEGGQNTDVVTGTVLGVSPDSRYVLISDVPRGLVFFIDTTGTRIAARRTIPGIRAVTFAADNSNIWIAGDNGVYVFHSDTFVPTLTNASRNVNALVWTPDGQSYFASGDQLVNYSTCDDQRNPQQLAGTPMDLSATAINGVPQVIGLSSPDGLWYNYSVTTPAQVPNPTNLPAKGNVCPPTVTINTPATRQSDLLCTAQRVKQITFSPTLEKAFVTGVDPICTPESVIHGYDVITNATIPNPTFPLGLNPTSTPTLTPVPIVPLSGGVLSDGRKLYVGTFDGTNGALLRRFNLDPTLGPIEEDVVPILKDVVPATTPPTQIVVGNTIPASVELIPSFVAVVPK